MLNSEASVQIAGGQVGGGAPTAPGNGACGIGSQVCNPATLQVTWNNSTAPFTTLTDAGFTLDLKLTFTAQIRVGPEVINLSGTPTVTVVPTALAVTSTFAPRFSIGNPSPATTTPTATATTGAAIVSYSSFSNWVTAAHSTLSTADPARQLSATGIYNRATNTFTATSIDFVL